MADVSESGVIDNIDLREASAGYTPFAVGDVLVAKITPCFENGKGAHVRGLPTRCGQGSTEFHVLRPRSTTYDRYLYHLTRTSQFRLHGEGLMSGSAGQRRVPTEFFDRYSVRMPPLEEQRRIADILDTVDETIRAADRVIAKLRASLSGIIDRSYDPQEGPLSRLADVCDGPGEYGCVAAAEPHRVSWPRYVRITDITDYGELRKDSVVGVRPSVARKAILRSGDIVFARSGSVGKTYLYDPADGPCAFAGYLIRFRPNSAKVLPEFVRWWTHTGWYWRWIRQTMRPGAQPNINAQEFATAPLPLPSLDQQRAIVAAVTRVSGVVKLEGRRREKLRQLRAGLADDLLSGRVGTVVA